MYWCVVAGAAATSCRCAQSWSTRSPGRAAPGPDDGCGAGDRRSVAPAPADGIRWYAAPNRRRGTSSPCVTELSISPTRRLDRLSFRVIRPAAGLFPASAPCRGQSDDVGDVAQGRHIASCWSGDATLRTVGCRVLLATVCADRIVINSRLCALRGLTGTVPAPVCLKCQSPGDARVA